MRHLPLVGTSFKSSQGLMRKKMNLHRGGRMNSIWHVFYVFSDPIAI